MATNDFPYVFPYSSTEARRLNRLPMWRESHKANIACKNAIEQAVRRDYDGSQLKPDCAGSVIAEYGFKRVQWVMANTVQQTRGGCFSPDSKIWARQTYIPPDKNDYKQEFVVNSQPDVLDSLISQYRRAYQALDLFDYTRCEPNSDKLDYEDKVVVLSPNILKESCWNQQNQLWLATGGFGCRASGSGRAVFATCLNDGEETRWNRTDFVGILREDHLPEWAREKLLELREQRPSNGGTPGMGGMEMK